MFEQGFRSDSNKQQMFSYAMAVNCLSLVSKENAWVLKPNPSCKMEIDDDDDDEVWNP